MIVVKDHQIHLRFLGLFFGPFLDLLFVIGHVVRFFSHSQLPVSPIIISGS